MKALPQHRALFGVLGQRAVMDNRIRENRQVGADTRLLADILRVRPQAARIALHTEKVVQMRGGFLPKEDVFNLARQIDAACDEVEFEEISNEPTT